MEEGGSTVFISLIDGRSRTECRLHFAKALAEDGLNQTRLHRGLSKRRDLFVVGSSSW
jgi:hypothetical protein